MTDTDRLAFDAGVPADLAALVVLAANRLDVRVRAFRGALRPPRFVTERRRVAVAARAHGFSYPVIGRALNRDHSTIVHHVRRAWSARA
jgi:chromosomal replication initiation ATPase DnaA